jgi:hypothetical protein
MGLLPPDFESGAYTNFATPAETLDNKAQEIARQERSATIDGLFQFRKHDHCDPAFCLFKKHFDSGGDPILD